MATVSRSDQTANGLTITLIITVALLFILAVICYFVFAERADALAELETARQELSTAQREKNEQQDAANQLKQILGVPENQSIDDIVREKDQAFGGDFSDFQADAKTYVDLANLLLSELRARDQDLLEERAKTAAEKANAANAVREKNEAVNAANADYQQKKADLAEIEANFNDDRRSFEEQQQELLAGQQAAQNESTALKNVKDTLAKKGEDYLSPQFLETFKEAAADPDPSAQIALLFEQLDKQTKEIAAKNRLIVELGAASPDVQEYLLSSLPQADRVDQFDGRILAIDEVNGTVEIAVPASLGLRPGLVFHVFSGRELTPLWSAKKAVVEVVSSRLGRVIARIRDEAMRDPIIVGDGVATPLWSPGMPMDVVIVGLVRIDSDRQEDSEELITRVEKLGGRVSATVEASTTMLVDAGQPVSRGGDDSREPVLSPQEVTRRNEQIEQAGKFGIRTVGLDVFLNWLGLDRETIRSGDAVDIPGQRVGRADSAVSIAE
jgi:hypothetical protein